jgi:hypothetical protein
MPLKASKKRVIFISAIIFESSNFFESTLEEPDVAATNPAWRQAFGVGCDPALLVKGKVSAVL